MQYTGRQVKEILKTHEKFCKCKVCAMRYAMFVGDKSVKMPEDDVVLIL